jgi:hypothetical protein
MSEVTDLERRYRRLLVCYPRAFRREHEQEILAVLMAGAGDGQQRPRLGDGGSDQERDLDASASRCAPVATNRVVGRLVDVPLRGAEVAGRPDASGKFSGYRVPA